MKSKHRAFGPRRRASIEDLERVHRTDFRMGAPKPLPAGRKPRQSMRALNTVPANEQAIRALRPDGTDQKRKVAGVPHLYVRVKPSGRRTFCAIKHMNDRRKANRTLGEVGQMTLREAKLACQVATLKWYIQELEAE
jgi:Arm DNA-binding domain